MRRLLPQREAYRYWADSFDQGTPILVLESRILTPHLEALAGERFLDIGAGTGRWLQFAVDHGVQAFGADLSHEMLRVAAAKPALAGKIIQADATRLPFRDAIADVVLSALTVGHVRPIQSALSELARIAAPEARVLITDFHPEALRRGWKRTFKHGTDTIELESDPYDIAELAHPHLTLEHFQEIPFGEEERHFFDAAGKSEWFDANRDQPAILLAQFRKRP